MMMIMMIMMINGKKIDIQRIHFKYNEILMIMIIIIMMMSVGVIGKKTADVPRIHFKYPDILLIGVMKGATTQLSNLLRDNPAICNYGEKEKHFFIGNDYASNYEASVQKYLDEFKGCKEAQLTLDATPGYSVEPYVIDRMMETYTADEWAKKKFIYIIREPVARHYSEYQMEVRLCLDLDEDLKSNNQIEYRHWRHERACENVMSDYHNKRNDPATSSKGYNKAARILTFHEWCMTSHGRLELRRGNYKEVILRFLNKIRRDQFFLINFDQLITNTTSVMVGMNNFLELKDKQRFSNHTMLPVPHKSAGKVVPTVLDCVTVEMLQRYFQYANGGNIDSWIRNMTSSRDGVDFGVFSDPTKKCVKLHSNNSSQEMKAAYPASTWTFVEDTINMHADVRLHGSTDGDRR